MVTIVTMMAANDPLTSIPVHKSVLTVLQRSKSSAETWDDFLLAVTDDYLSPMLKAELEHRERSDRIVSGAEAKREFEGLRRRAH